MSIQKREIRIKIMPNGEIKFDNAGNPDEKRILQELAELSKLLTGDEQGVKIEKHVHTHSTSHTHDHTHVDGGHSH